MITDQEEGEVGGSVCYPCTSLKLRAETYLTTLVLSRTFRLKEAGTNHLRHLIDILSLLSVTVRKAALLTIPLRHLLYQHGTQLL